MGGCAGQRARACNGRAAFMKFGAHVSMAGGVVNAPSNAAKIGCEVLQMFTRPPMGGSGAKLTAKDGEDFTAAMKEHGILRAYIHAPYYINLASGKKEVRASSARIIREELERGSVLGCTAVMFHPGSAKDVGEEEGMRLVIETIDKVMDGYRGTCQLLIEISAGAGATMGDTFEDVAAMLKGAKRGRDMGVCFDTQHAFASGYDLRDAKAVNETMKRFDAVIGLERLVMSHLNDSKVPFADHKDRHEHIGDGHIGEKGIRAFVQHPKLQHLDLVLETPHDEKIQSDMAFLKRARGR